MSQDNHANTTAERAAPTRRALLCTAPVAIAAAALPDIPLLGPPSAATPQCSPEFREWYALAMTTDEVVAADNIWDRENPGSDIDEGPAADLYNAMGKLEDQIFAKPVRSQTDIDELAIIALYWEDTDAFLSQGPDILHPDVDSPCRNDRSTAHLIQATARLALERLGLGGAHV